MKEKKILSSYSIGLENFYLIECSNQLFADKDPKIFFIVKHEYLDELQQPARIIIDYCDTYIDAIYHFKDILNDRIRIELVDKTFGIKHEVIKK